jgi:hypothetical protein
MSSPAEHLRDYLVAQAVSTSASTFFGGDTPANPAELTVVRDTPGLVPQEFMGSTDVMEQFGLQVIVRAETEAAGNTRVQAAYTALRRVCHQTISGTRYISLIPITPPFALGADEGHITSGGSPGRKLWSVNFLGQRDI